MAKLKVAMLATPWIKVPPDGYGGTEVVVDGLSRQLIKMGVEVDLFTIAKSRVRGAKVLSLYKDEQYKHIHRPLYENSPIIVGHVQHALDELRILGAYDI